jgi:hypothetical protein
MALPPPVRLPILTMSPPAYRSDGPDFWLTQYRLARVIAP